MPPVPAVTVMLADPLVRDDGQPVVKPPRSIDASGTFCDW